MADKDEAAASVAGDKTVDEVVERLLEKADASGAALLGKGGLLTEITKAVLERALEAEMSEYLGYERVIWRVTGRGTPATGRRPRRSSPMPARSRWRCRGTTTATSNRGWSRRTPAGSPGSTTGSSRSTHVG
ncbi:hypothetical protein GCM10010493_81270 [Streptomyces lavendulae subsp. grasserius]